MPMHCRMSKELEESYYNEYVFPFSADTTGCNGNVDGNAAPHGGGKQRYLSKEDAVPRQVPRCIVKVLQTV